MKGGAVPVAPTHMRKYGIFIFFLVVPMLLAGIGSSSFFNPVKINSYAVDVTIDNAGNMTVSETWDMNYASEKRVWFRDIGYNKYAEGYPLPMSSINTARFDEDSVVVRVSIDGVDVTSDIELGYSFAGDYDELGYPVACEPASSTCESIFVDAYYAGGLFGNVVFETQYTILGVITQYSDIAELNWRLFDFVPSRIKNATVTVHLPANGHALEDLYVWGHGLSKGTIEIVANDEIQMVMQDIRKDEFIEFRILTATDLFPAIAARNIFLNSGINKDILVAYEADLADQTNLRITIAQIVLYAAFAVSAAMAAITYFVYVKYDKEYIPRFQGEYFRDLPSEATPAEMSYLYYMKKINDEDVTATLLDLIRKKYVAIDYAGKDLTAGDADFVLALNVAENQSRLLAHERHVIDWFFNVIGDGKTVSTEQIEKFGKKGIRQAEAFQNAARQFVRLAKQAGDKHDYFEAGLAKDRSKALIFLLVPLGMLGIAFLTQAFFILDNTIAMIMSAVIAVAYGIYVYTIKKRSIAGNEEFVKWRAFRNFLVDFGNMKDYPMPGVVVWEHYLVYATSLKVADKVMEQLKVKLPMDEAVASEATFMGVGYRARGFYFGYALGRFQRSISTAKINAVQTITAHNAAKVGSGGRGGGFGGGSSFGGGGGGIRTR